LKCKVTMKNEQEEVVCRGEIAGIISWYKTILQIEFYE
jgi:hypothetical protein